MKRQMIKGLTMSLALVVLTLASALVASAQESKTLWVNIPFEFNVGDRTLPAGEYNVTRMTSGGATISITGDESAVRLTSLIVKLEPAKGSKLVFHRYGNASFLSEVWTAGYSNGRQLVKSKSEARLQREMSKIARDSKQYDLIEVAVVR